MSRHDFGHSIIILANLLVVFMLVVSFSRSYAVENNPSTSKPNQVLGQSNNSFIPPKYANSTLQETADHINQYRKQQGLLPLSQSKDLDNIAKFRVQDMLKNNYYAHKSPSGTIFSDIMKDHKISFGLTCENLNLSDFNSAQRFVSSWQNSPEHDQCILRSTHTKAGYATAKLNYSGVSDSYSHIIVAIYSD